MAEKARVIAIDGPSGAGKSSVSRAVGKRLGFLHVDSGALYRIMTWQCLEKGVDTSDPAAVAACARQVEIECRAEDGCIAYHLRREYHLLYVHTGHGRGEAIWLEPHGLHLPGRYAGHEFHNYYI